MKIFDFQIVTNSESRKNVIKREKLAIINYK